tara:strand:- start:1066 stop:1809 length:744 start_codon:yes stop_codon:yes gene_type:complete
MTLTWKDLIEPLTLEEFHEEYHRKKFCIIKGNPFRKRFFEAIITWKELSDYINNDRAVSGLQAIVPGPAIAARGSKTVTPPSKKLCMEKYNLHKKKRPSWSKEHYYEKDYLHKIWEDNGSIILTKASLLTPNISAIAGAIETHFGGAADAHFYCSKAKDGLSFPFHRDTDDNFLIHASGTVRWIVHNSLENIQGDTSTFDLTVGDMLYIPSKTEHRAIAQSRRISISVPLIERGIPKTLDRKYYNFT